MVVHLPPHYAMVSHDGTHLFFSHNESNLLHVRDHFSTEHDIQRAFIVPLGGGDIMCSTEYAAFNRRNNDFALLWIVLFP